MTARRYAIVLTGSEDTSLRQQYVQFGIPDGQYKKRPAELELFTDTWNAATGRSDTSDELLHYIETQRKQKHKNWPTFDGQHRKAPAASGLLSGEEEVELRRLYSELIIPLCVGTDTIAHDPQMIQALADAFALATGRVIPPMLLMAFIEARRKRRKWLALKRDYRAGFDDIDDVGEATA